MGRGLAPQSASSRPVGDFDARQAVTLSPGVAPQRGLLSLSHEVRTINPFKSLLPLPLVVGRKAGPGPPGWAAWPCPGRLSCSQISAGSAPTAHCREEWSSCWQQRYRLASGLGCGKEEHTLVVLTGVVIFSEVLSEDSCHTDVGRCPGLASGGEKAKPPDNHGPTVATELCLKVLQHASSGRSFCGHLGHPWGCQVALVVKSSLPMQET